MTAARTVARTGRISAVAVEAMAGLLDLEVEPIVSSGVLPPMWHCGQFLELPAQGELGADGHPLAGVPTPPGPGLRRMFAGGRTTHLRPLRLEADAVRVTEVTDEVVKQGRTGLLTFVTVRHRIEQDGELAVVEENDIVYRSAHARASAPIGASAPVSPSEPVPPAAPGSASFVVDPVVLFRFSALTYNAHRIHYDRPYASSEGYPDLVVHGPLQVLLMAEYLRAADVDVIGRVFRYRLLAPAFGAQRVDVTGDPRGRVIVTGTRSGEIARGSVETL